MVSFSFSIIDYKGFTYGGGGGGSRHITVFRPDKNSFSSQSDDRLPLNLQEVGSRGLIPS